MFTAHYVDSVRCLNGASTLARSTSLSRWPDLVPCIQDVWVARIHLAQVPRRAHQRSVTATELEFCILWIQVWHTFHATSLSLPLIELEQIGLDSASVQWRFESRGPGETSRVRPPECPLIGVLIDMWSAGEVLKGARLVEALGMLDGIPRFLLQDGAVVRAVICAARCGIWTVTHSWDGPLGDQVVVVGTLGGGSSGRLVPWGGLLDGWLAWGVGLAWDGVAGASTDLALREEFLGLDLYLCVGVHSWGPLGDGWF